MSPRSVCVAAIAVVAVLAGCGGESTSRTNGTATIAIRGLTNGFRDVTSPAFTPPSGSVIYAVFVSNGPNSGAAQALTGVTNTGTPLTWHLLKRSNAQSATLGGDVEVWWAFNATSQSNVRVSGHLAIPAGSGNPDGYLQTPVFDHAAADQSNAAAVAKSSSRPAKPSATLTTSAPNSWVWGAVSNWTNSIVGTAGSGQSLVAQSHNPDTGKSWWSQRRNAVTPKRQTAVNIDVGEPNVAYNMVAFEVLAGPGTQPPTLASELAG
jgi:hypothetical protein